MKEKTSKLISVILVAPPLFFIIMCIFSGFRTPFSEDATLSYYGTMYAGCLSGVITAYALYITVQNNKKQYDLYLLGDQIRDIREGLTLIDEIDNKIQHIVRNSGRLDNDLLNNQLDEIRFKTKKLDTIRGIVMVTVVSEFLNNEIQENQMDDSSEDARIIEKAIEFINLYRYHTVPKDIKNCGKDVIDRLERALKHDKNNFELFFVLMVQLRKNDYIKSEDYTKFLKDINKES